MSAVDEVLRLFKDGQLTEEARDRAINEIADRGIRADIAKARKTAADLRALVDTNEV